MTSPSLVPAQLAVLFTEIGEQLAEHSTSDSVLRALSELAVERVMAADHAGITVGRTGAHFHTAAATSDVVRHVDQIQYDLNCGPCVDAIVDDTTLKSPDLRTDPRWPEFGARAYAATGIRSLLSTRLYLETDAGLIAGLNVYAHHADAFDDASETMAVLLAAHGSLAVARASAEARAQNLLVALQNSREIGIAMGVIMITHKVTRDEAFNLLRIISQRAHRKLHDIAADIADTGEIPDL